MGSGNRHKTGDEKAAEMLVRAVDSLGSPGACPPLEDIAALLDGGLTGHRRDTVMAHLAACDRCREVYTTASVIGEPHTARAGKPSATSGWWGAAWLTPYAVAAGLVLAAVSGGLIYNEYFNRSGLDYYAGTEETPSQSLHKAKQREPEPSLAMDAAATAERGADLDAAVPESKTYAMDRKKDARKPSGPEPPALMDAADALRYAKTAPETKDIQPPPAPMRPAAMEPVRTEEMEKPRMAISGAREETYDTVMSGGEYRASKAEQQPPMKSAIEGDSGAGMMSDDFSPAPSTRRVAGVAGGDSAERADSNITGAAVRARAIAEDERASANESAAAVMAAPEPKEQRAVEAAPGPSALALPEATAEPARLFKVTGILKSIDLEKGEITLLPLGKSETMVIEVRPEDLRGFEVGDDIMVQYEKRKAYFATRIKKARTIVVPVGC